MNSARNIDFKRCIGRAASLMFLSALVAAATPIRLTVQPKGTNQVELTFGPVVPDVVYGVLARTNGPEGYWMTFATFIGGSNKNITATCNLGGAGDLKGLSLETLNKWKFVAGYWDDSDGNGLPDLYKDLATRTFPGSPDDGYSDPDGDGWCNLQEYQNNTDPLRWDQEPPGQSGVGINHYTNGVVKITWSQWGGALPDYFVIERALRTLQPNLNPPPLVRPGMLLNQTNPAAILAQQRQLQRLPGQPLNRQRLDPFVTSPFQVVATVAARPGLHDYHYEATNVAMSPLVEPLYRIHAHYTPPIHAVPTKVDAMSIRETVRSVVVNQTTNGYDLTVMRPVAHAWYLLLVRDKKNPQWRSSGYFIGETNSSVHLHVDLHGMMAVNDQKPIVMPDVHFPPALVDPEFTAGCGEDSDGDGLPDIYEVLVTSTDPDNADTGNMGILDGYKELANDGWSCLEKFRRRVDPLQPAYPPPPVELHQPTLANVAQTTAPRGDLTLEPQIQIRMMGDSNYHQLRQPLEMFYRALSPRDPSKVNGNFDLRITWQVPAIRPHPSGNGP